MKIDLDRFAARFRQETRDNLELMDKAVARLDINRNQSDSGRNEDIRELMRLAHAIKGAAKMLGFDDINRLCHALEDQLISIRECEVIERGQIDLIVEARKAVERLLTSIGNEAATSERQVWVNPLIESLRVAPVTPSPTSVSDFPSMHKGDRGGTLLSGGTVVPPVNSWRDTTVRVDVESLDDLLMTGRELTQALDGLSRAQGQIDRIRSRLETILDSGHKGNGSDRGAGVPLAEAHELLGNLTLYSLNLRDRISDVDRSVRRIDSGALELRMRPISELFDTIPLQVRDLSSSLQKEVDVEFTGETVRLDARIIELLREPLLHIIRNSIDHGIESSNEREAVRKPSRGRLTIGASENAGWARIVVADDGRGIGAEYIWSRARQLGLVAESEEIPLDPRQVYRILFDDRFTSRTGATEVSGRGVGLAAVRKRLHELRGEVSVDSVPGMGARFTLIMPTSLSCQRTLIVASDIAGKRAFFALPTAMVLGTSRRKSIIGSQSIDESLSSEGEPESYFSLAGLLQFNTNAPSHLENYLVHCSDGLRSASLAVTQIVAESEVVIESLPHVTRSAELIAGAAQLTSEEIVLIVNVPLMLDFAFSSSSRLRK